MGAPLHALHSEEDQIPDHIVTGLIMLIATLTLALEVLIPSSVPTRVVDTTPALKSRQLIYWWTIISVAANIKELLPTSSKAVKCLAIN